ncbi:hypothetical protein KNT87_gp095 [Erwinia phage Cronus]|uniref:Uncharacterized protein n=1 Tax=Erwinia phage Cronus TaxID=2163633 RepID=A0A2S1GMC9_9CAUD|nr:hypothetical protein KNT87_gp095 [Erwinia phage Cronus]AWD90534.1 hypothetical protein [Erwinia phage Cronus]
MSKAIKFNEVHKLVPGVKLFHIIGAPRNRLFNVNDITEFEIMSNVYNEPHEGIPGEVLWMDGVFTHFNHAGVVLVKGDKRNASLRDGGISRDGTVYNLNRFFWTHQDAQLFLRELNCGVFSDEVDQKEFNKRGAPKTWLGWE